VEHMQPVVLLRRDVDCRRNLFAGHRPRSQANCQVLP
jgi:hypothetical protein